MTRATNEGDPTPTPCAPTECTSMSLRITGEFEGGEVVCDSKQEKKCTLDGNSSFTVEIVPNKIPSGGYAFWQTELDYGALLYRPRDLSEEITWEFGFLPLRDPDVPDGREGRVAHTDVSPLLPPLLSSQSTTLVTLEFECTSSDELRLVSFDESRAGTVFGGVAFDEIFVPEVGEIDVSCGPTATPTPCAPIECTSMSLRITGEFEGGEVVCDSKDVTDCTLDSDSSFTVEIVPDTIPQGGYSFWATHLNYGTLMYQTRDLSEEITWDLSFFPKRAPESAELDWVAHGDFSAYFPPFPRSDQKTALVTLDFNCNTSDTLSMIGFDASPDGSVFGGESADDIFIPEVSAMDIVCTDAATLTPGPPADTPPPPPAPDCGDIDESGAVDSRDALLVLQIDGGFVALPAVLPPPHWDVNADGAIDARDAALVLQFEAGLLAALVC